MQEQGEKFQYLQEQGNRTHLKGEDSVDQLAYFVEQMYLNTKMDQNAKECWAELRQYCFKVRSIYVD